MNSNSRVMRTAVAAGSVLSLGLGLSACGMESDSQGYDGEASAICVDKTTHERLDDSRCDYNGSGYNAMTNGMMWYLLAGQMAPRYGAPVTSGSSVRPNNYYISNRNVPKNGGAVPKSPSNPPMKVLGGTNSGQQDKVRSNSNSGQSYQDKTRSNPGYGTKSGSGSSSYGKSYSGGSSSYRSGGFSSGRR